MRGTVIACHAQPPSSLTSANHSVSTNAARCPSDHPAAQPSTESLGMAHVNTSNEATIASPLRSWYTRCCAKNHRKCLGQQPIEEISAQLTAHLVYLSGHRQYPIGIFHIHEKREQLINYKPSIKLFSQRNEQARNPNLLTRKHCSNLLAILQNSPKARQKKPRLA